MNIEFEHHPGVQHDDGSVVFYGMIFSGILEAAVYLKRVHSGYNYKGTMNRGVNILKDIDADLYFTGDRWWPDKAQALEHALRVKHRQLNTTYR